MAGGTLVGRKRKLVNSLGLASATVAGESWAGRGWCACAMVISGLGDKDIMWIRFIFQLRGVMWLRGDLAPSVGESHPLAP